MDYVTDDYILGLNLTSGKTEVTCLRIGSELDSDLTVSAMYVCELHIQYTSIGCMIYNRTGNQFD